MLIKRAKFILIVAVMALAAMTAMACQSIAGQSSSPQPTNTPTPTSNYVGHFSLSPSSGLPGTVVKATGNGFAADMQLEIVWQGFSGSWQVGNGTFQGRQFKDQPESMAPVTTDAAGQFQATFTVPDGFGFSHDVLVMKDGQVQNKAAFEVTMQAAISPSSGSVGTPITVELKGVGWRPLENSWVLLYDNKFTGWLSAVTTDGHASAVIPAVGALGEHTIQIVHASATFPYLNMQQSPQPNRPTWTFKFMVTDGSPILPPPAQEQALTIEQGTSPSAIVGASLWVNPASGLIGTPVTLKGEGLPSGQSLDILWFRMTGNRVGGQGWQETSVKLGTVMVGANGAVDFSFPAPDDLGGSHRIEAQANGQKLAETYFTITPSAFGIEPSSGPVGTTITIHLKGVGWTQTANIYTLVYDNGYLGYACGFNSQGDVTIYLPAAGEPGWHFIDLYPGIYQGADMNQVNDFRIPQLTFKDDHPGERLPAFHFAFRITEGGN